MLITIIIRPIYKFSRIHKYYIVIYRNNEMVNALEIIFLKEDFIVLFLFETKSGE